ncbi:MAG: CpaF family protein [Coriobacteriales bacterium]|jgi:pilus assembly protein CpaF|nr:CpaF family protein [Coriobacteriales bacterium]
MSLLSYLQSQESDLTMVTYAADAGKWRLELRDALFERLSSECIAELLLRDGDRARLEVVSTLKVAAQDVRFCTLSVATKSRLIQEVADLVLGLGPLEELLSDQTITEIMVNGASQVFYEREGKLYRSKARFNDEQQLRMVIDRIVSPLGRRVDEQSPFVSARLATGHRVNVVIPPLSLDGSILTIRKFRDEIFTLDELTKMGSIDSCGAQLLRWAVLCRRTIAVSGGTGSGKTTFLNALSVEIPPYERIITIEDAAELRFSKHPHVVRLEARPRNAEGCGEVSIRDLMINALRMRPDRIVVGECRGAEALDMLQAMNTGHDGSLTTLHANSPYEVPKRLVMMARYAMDLPVSIIEEQIASALDIVVQLDRFGDGRRRVTSICEFGSSSASGLSMTQLCVWDTTSSRYHWKARPGWLNQQGSSCQLDAEEVKAWIALAGL